MIQQLTLEWLNSESQIPQALWDNCFPAPYEGQWWYRSLECSHLEKQFTFTYGLISLNEEPIAIAPAFVMDVPIELVMPPLILPIVKIIGKIIPSFLYQRTFFIGSACSDEGHIGIDPNILKNNVVTQDDIFICIQVVKNGYIINFQNGTYPTKVAKTIEEIALILKETLIDFKEIKI